MLQRFISTRIKSMLVICPASLRKLLASSTHAVHNTLITIKRRLETLRDHQVDDFDFIAELIESDDRETDYLKKLDSDGIDDSEQVIDKNS
jgi:hypothetical protein